MTNYNDGKWHGWNGGECPVHPKTIGDITYYDGTVYNECKLGQCDWSLPLMFRVTKEYKEPRRIWVNEYPNGFEASSIYDDEKSARSYAGTLAIRVVEFVEVLK